jgi:hypothetical protein
MSWHLSRDGFANWRRTVVKNGHGCGAAAS